MKFRIKIDVSSTETRKGIKVQFVLPSSTLDIAAKEAITQQLQNKLSTGLKPLGLNINVDTDIQFSNVVGFLILLPDFKSLIKKVLTNGTTKTPQETNNPVT